MAFLTYLPQIIHILSVRNHLLAFPAALAEVYAGEVCCRSGVEWVVLVEERKDLDVLGCEGVLCCYGLESIELRGLV